jgi:hypothetical protein
MHNAILLINLPAANGQTYTIKISCFIKNIKQNGPGTAKNITASA